MSAAELHIVYEPDEDGTGKIVATAKTGAFAAQGEAWFGRNLESFLGRLRAYPLSSQTPPTIDGGYWDGKGVLVQWLIRITIKPYDLAAGCSYMPS
ncbi:hypothetical protein [Bradyrhizobium sp. HKCCYLRH1030]|uniref:hypothetical protein n=1 Tax=Bradyrhizobium sp. HKCCYLRH1030 TaxID=3420744 RepID=UPI003EB997F0